MPGQNKQQIRESLKKARASLTDKQRREKSRQIRENLFSTPELQDFRSIFCFLSYGNEVQTHKIVDYFLESGRKVAVPSLIQSNHMIAREFTNWQCLEKGQLGILSPPPAAPEMKSFDITLTPGLGFSLQGDRIGYGRGYYDRWFAGHISGIKIALAFDVQICTEIPVDDNDVKIDIIITESQIFRIQ